MLSLKATGVSLKSLWIARLIARKADVHSIFAVHQEKSILWPSACEHLGAASRFGNTILRVQVRRNTCGEKSETAVVHKTFTVSWSVFDL
jgi:hypothetical protein